jgi:C1A family cysteine protease
MQHIAAYGHSYGTIEEYNFRYVEFERHEEIIAAHNATESTFTLGHNKFSTWTDAEYKRILGYKESIIPQAPAETFDESNYQAAASVDWRNHNAVTPIKDQGQCGSCWAFSSTGCMEGANAIKNGSLVSLAEQQFVSCVTLCFGCNGGNYGIVFSRYSPKNPSYGESAWPYTATNGTCSPPSGSTTGISMSGGTAVTTNSKTAMMAALEQQPVSVSIEADKSVFQSYQSGVFSSSQCGTSLDHAVLLVGYSTGTSEGDYFILKNSWGTSWGDAGYMKLGMEANGTDGYCGVYMNPMTCQAN